EVLVALALLAVSGVAMISLLGQTTRSMRSMRESEEATSAASRVLDRFAALDRDGLLASLGRHDAGGFRASVVEASADLFGVDVALPDPSAALLRTVFYRPDSSRDVAP